MLNRQQKGKIIDELSEKLKKVKSVVFVDYKGLTVFQLHELRAKLKEVETEFKIAKKTLIDLALKKNSYKDISSKKMSGQIALVLNQKDEISAAKILDNFSKKEKNLKILGAILDGNFLNQEEALHLARVPSAGESLTKLVSLLNSPISGFVSVLNGNIRNLIFVLSQVKKT